MPAQAWSVRAHAQGQQVTIQQEAIYEYDVQANRRRSEYELAEEERLARVARFQHRVERHQHQREGKHGKRCHGEGKIYHTGIRGYVHSVTCSVQRWACFC